MKKIDLHTHTVSTISDKPFDFSFSKLKEYVEVLGIDCIAITNHNLFDLEQFNQIINYLSNTTVFPGIEIDLEGGHLLLISENSNLSDFSNKCKLIEKLITHKEDYISVDKLKEIFPNLTDYLLIPHYEKSPNIRPETLEKLNIPVYAGEVTSIKKFKSCIKDKDSLVPLIFSDLRFYDSLTTFPPRQTYIDLKDISLLGIKSCLSDKNKVSLSKEDGNDFFEATKDLMLSTGLNVILGERSSGKTYTLNSIFSSFENIKYIKQFSLLQNDANKFEELLSVRHSTVSETYLKEFKGVVEDIVTVDLKQNEIDFEKYLDSLLKSASENEKADTFSKATLFSESLYSKKDLSNLIGLISSVEKLIENSEYREIIDKHISIENLKTLVIDLIQKYYQSEELNLKQEWLNNLISDVKNGLRLRTSSTIVEDIDFYKIVLDNKKIEKFSQVVDKVKIEKEVNSKEIGGFKVVANTKKYTGASQLKDKSKRKISFTETFKQYSKPYNYLLSLKTVDLEETEYYKYFININYETLNKHGFPVSGGERSEFNLLHEINDALKYDMLLIDEPESSFDNIFLKNEVNKLIKDISKEIPVILVTHNNTVGASVQPDYVLYTQKVLENSNVKYKIFYGYPSDKQLKSNNGETIDNYTIMLNCLEAGKEAYNERRVKSYEILKN